MYDFTNQTRNMFSTFQPPAERTWTLEELELLNGSFSNLTTTTTTTITTISLSNNDSSLDPEEPGVLGHHPHLVPVMTGVQIIGFTLMVSVCSVLGTLGNVLVLLVYCAKTERRTANTFIKVLAIIDLVVCAVIMPYSIVLELHLVTSDILCRIFEFVRHVSVTASNLTLVAIAVERYVAVCAIEHRLTVHHVHQGMFVVVGVSVVMAIPSMGLFAAVTTREVQGIRCAFPHHFDDNASFCHFTTSLLGPELSVAYQMALMIFFFVTFLVIVVLYAVVYCSLWKRAKRRSLSQSFTVDTEASSSGERRRPRESSLPDEGGPDKQEQDCSGLCQRSEALQGRPGDSRANAGASLGASCDFDEAWAKNDEETLTTAATATARARRVNTQSQAMHRRTARMLFLCSVVFLVTWLPFWVDVFNNTHNLCLRYLFFVGNASNPLVYGIANSQFRSSLFKLLMGVRPPCGACRERLKPQRR